MTRYRSRSGFSVHIAVLIPTEFCQSSTTSGRNPVQSLTPVSGVRLFKRRKGKLETNIHLLETLSLQLLHSVSSLDDPQTLYTIFFALGFPDTNPFHSRVAGRHKKPGHAFHCLCANMFLVLKCCTSGSWACSFPQKSLCFLLCSGSTPAPTAGSPRLLPRPWIRSAPVWDLLNLKNSRALPERLIFFALKAMHSDALAAHLGQPGAADMASKFSLNYPRQNTAIDP